MVEGSRQGNLQGCMPSQHPRARPAGPDLRRDTTRRGRLLHGTRTSHARPSNACHSARPELPRRGWRGSRRRTPSPSACGASAWVLVRSRGQLAPRVQDLPRSRLPPMVGTPGVIGHLPAHSGAVPERVRLLVAWWLWATWPGAWPQSLRSGDYRVGCWSLNRSATFGG